MLRPVSIDHVTGWLDARLAVMPREALAVPAAPGRVLAESVSAPDDLPSAPVSAVDGYALSSEATVGASDYNPLSFPVKDAGEATASGSEAVPVVSGQALPGGADTVIPVETVDRRAGVVEIYEPVAPGDNVIPVGREARGGDRLLDAGRVLRAADTALLIEHGLSEVYVTRRPRVRVIVARDDIRDAVGPMIRSLVASDGGVADPILRPGRDGLAAVLAAGEGDLLLVIGGSGPGSNDHAAAALAEAGELVYRGVAINPGETTTLGTVGDMPVILLPGPALAALFAYDMIAGRAVRRLAGRGAALPYGTRRAVLDRKVASGLGRLECCRVRVAGDRATPLAIVDNRTLSTVVRADGFVPVPEHSEGWAAGAEVNVYMYDQRCHVDAEAPDG